MIGNDDTIGGNDHARADRLLHALPLPLAKELAEGRIVKERIARPTLHPRAINIDHGRCGAFHDRGKAQRDFPALDGTSLRLVTVSPLGVSCAVAASGCSRVAANPSTSAKAKRGTAKRFKTGSFKELFCPI